ncbi:hypothetical protein ABEF95_014259 [Exophiala dermatitidis]
MGDVAPVHTSTSNAIPPFIDTVIPFPETRTSYVLERPLATYKQCQDGTPAEARMVFTCRRKPLTHESNASSETDTDADGFVIKIKVQIPDHGHSAEAGPSTTTAAELKALRIFRDAKCPFAPTVADYKQTTQGPNGPFPGGYITYTVMTKMPGESLHDSHFWGQAFSDEERKEVQQKFLVALRAIYDLGIEPVDCALRNVLWEHETKRCTIIDFELWREPSGPIADETRELQRWGIARQPAAKTWFEAWNSQWR